MKKNIFSVFCVILCFQYVQAQDSTQLKQQTDLDIKEIAKTESTHTLDIGFISAGYTYEYAFAPKFTLNFGVGAVSHIRHYSSFIFDAGDFWYYSIHPYVTVEPRYYYNLQKRLNKGKRIDGNRGSFLALQGAYIFKPVIEYNVQYRNGAFFVSPYWGLHRIWWNHVLFEFQAGMAFAFNRYGDSDTGIRLGIRLGYKF